MIPGFILFSKCIIRNVLSTQQWKNPFEERNFSIPFVPQTLDYNDYRMAGIMHSCTIQTTKLSLELISTVHGSSLHS